MNLAFTIKFLADLCFYMFAVSSLASCAPHSGLIITSPLIIALAACASRILDGERFRKRPYLRFLPLLLTAACLIFTREAMDIIVTAPMLIYLVYVMAKRAYAFGYDQSVARFYLCIKITVVPVLLMIIASNYVGLRDVMLPYFLFFFILSIMLLRMLRHNERVIADAKFQLVSSLQIAMLCGAGYLLSSGYMLAAFKFVISLLSKYILKPILTGVVYIFGGFAWLLNKIFSGVDFGMQDIDMSMLDELGESAEDTGMAQYGAEEAIDNSFREIAVYVLIALGAALVIIILILLFRAFLKAGRRARADSFDGVREALDEDLSARDRRLTRAPRDRVRHYYRKFLRLINSNGCDTDETFDTREIARAARARFDRDEVEKLRGVYVRARYSSADITASDAAAAKNALAGIRKKKM